jgi:uncharacterized protein YdiU (UPF0061 family)
LDPNTTDQENRRYRLGTNQKLHWNLYQLANSLYPLIEEAALESILNSFQTDYEADYASMMRNKLGLF